MVCFLSLKSLITFATIPDEQGHWAAKTVLEILDGLKPKDIPITTNQKAKVLLNMKLAKKLDLVFPIELVEQATFVSERELK